MLTDTRLNLEMIAPKGCLPERTDWDLREVQSSYPAGHSFDALHLAEALLIYTPNSPPSSPTAADGIDRRYGSNPTTKAKLGVVTPLVRHHSKLSWSARRGHLTS